MSKRADQWDEVICPECGYIMMVQVTKDDKICIPHSCPKCGTKIGGDKDE